MYANNPFAILRRHNVINYEEAKENILGGETALWVEQSSEGNILSKAFIDHLLKNHKNEMILD